VSSLQNGLWGKEEKESLQEASSRMEQMQRSLVLRRKKNQTFQEKGKKGGLFQEKKLLDPLPFGRKKNDKGVVETYGDNLSFILMTVVA